MSQQENILFESMPPIDLGSSHELPKAIAITMYEDGVLACDERSLCLEKEEQALFSNLVSYSGAPKPRTTLLPNVCRDLFKLYFNNLSAKLTDVSHLNQPVLQVLIDGKTEYQLDPNLFVDFVAEKSPQSDKLNKKVVSVDFQSGKVIIDTPEIATDQTESSSTNNWLAKAACRGSGNTLFFSENVEDINAAKAVCKLCSVREDCLEYAIQNREKDGIWGGLDQEELQKKFRRSKK